MKLMAERKTVQTSARFASACRLQTAYLSSDTGCAVTPCDHLAISTPAPSRSSRSGSVAAGFGPSKLGGVGKDESDHLRVCVRASLLIELADEVGVVLQSEQSMELAA